MFKDDHFIQQSNSFFLHFFGDLFTKLKNPLFTQFFFLQKETKDYILKLFNEFEETLLKDLEESQ